jgi:methylthioribose-1-phosphate isomerase
MKESILFWPVRLEGETLLILDETKVPGEVFYIKAHNYKEAIRAVVDMKTRAFGQFLTVCYAFMLEVKKAKKLTKDELFAHLKVVAEAFNKSRPTFPFEEVTGMVLGFAQKAFASPRFAEDFLKAMEGFLEGGIRRQRYGRAEAAAKLIPDNAAVLTHCHVSGEMSLVGEFCRENNKKIRFYATETRPYFQGARLTAWELEREGFDVTLVPDNAVATLMAGGLVQCVLVGSDRSAKNGDFANKIGTYQIALLAKHFNIPFYVLVQPSDKLNSGRDIPIEVRDDDEVLVFNGHRLGSEKLEAYYPGFDVVDHRLVTQHIAIQAGRPS